MATYRYRGNPSDENSEIKPRAYGSNSSQKDQSINSGSGVEKVWSPADAFIDRDAPRTSRDKYGYMDGNKYETYWKTTHKSRLRPWVKTVIRTAVGIGGNIGFFWVLLQTAASGNFFLVLLTVIGWIAVVAWVVNLLGSMDWV